MRGLDNYNPIAVCVCFLCTALLGMFVNHPLISLVSFAAALTLFFVCFGAKSPLSHLFYLGMLGVMALINPIFQHNGKTVLLIVNNNPITLEALCYGLSMSVAVVAVIYWFRVFSSVMTGDKLLYVLGHLSPKLSLILSMTLRYIPLFGKQSRRVQRAQTALGLYKGDNLIDRIKGGSAVFSVMVTWALENGIITADSMTARGYGTGRRSSFSLFSFKARDTALLLISLTLCALCIAGKALGALEFGYYPEMSPLLANQYTLPVVIVYGLLSFIPSLIEITENIKWRCLKSAI